MPEQDNDPNYQPSQVQVQTHRMSREQFRTERARAFELASQGHQVIVLDDDLQPTMVLTTPRDKQTMRLD